METVRLGYLQKLTDRVGEIRRTIHVIYGPRQVGKTTLVFQFLKRTALFAHYVSADNAAQSGSSWVSQQWETARLQMKSKSAEEGLLVIDEIQKITNWSEVVKKEWDADTRNGIQLKVILLGSSRILLQTGLTESLAGRFETMVMSHWSFTEIHEAFGMSPEHYVWFGGYPGAAELIKDEARWRNYVVDSLIEATISRDILMMTRVDKPALMKRLFELGCLYSGQVLSLTKIVGQLQEAGNTTTLSHYLSLLDSAGMLGGLSKYSPNMIRKRASSPKFQVYNSAFLSALSPESFDQVRNDPAKWGRWVESAIGAHLINSVQRSGIDLYYWREGNMEVDLVMEYRGKTIGLEVKSGHTQKRLGMMDFQKKFNPDKVLMVGAEGLPWQEFLKIEPTDLF